MRILGLEIRRVEPRLRSVGTAFEERSQYNQIRAAAPHLPPLRTDGAMTEIMPPFGTNPPNRPTGTAETDLGSRVVTSDPRELWYLALPSKLSPKQVLQILRSALGGDLWQQWQLLALMLDTWPIFRKCYHELCDAVAYTRFVARPHCEEGEDPSEIAIQKAALFNKAAKSFKPDPFTDEKDFASTVYQLCDAMANGLSMVELIWGDPDDQGRGDWQRLPKAGAWVHPRHYAFTNDGRISIYGDDYKRLTFPLATDPRRVGPDPDKFLCAQFVSRAGSCLAGGLVRTLGWYWSAVVFNREWMLNTAMKYGSPFLDVSYKMGATQSELAALDDQLAKAGPNGWIRHPEGSTIEVHPATSLGTDNPQRYLADEADKACLYLMLGQASTTVATAGKLGNEKEKDKVKLERVAGMANWIAKGPLTQLARALCRVNFGEESECPEITPDFTEESTPMEEATRDKVFLDADVPMMAEDFYRKHNLKMPQPGDLVVVGGRLGLLAEPDPEIGGKPEPIIPPGGAQDGDGKDTFGAEDDNGEKQVAARVPVRVIKQLASPEDLVEIERLAVAAHEAPHHNGEIKSLRRKLAQVAAKSRVQTNRRNRL